MSSIVLIWRNESIQLIKGSNEKHKGKKYNYIYSQMIQNDSINGKTKRLKIKLTQAIR